MREITVSEYFVEFLIENGVTDIFGYQGGMVCHIFDALGKYNSKINYHHCCSEQGASFAACGYAQATGKLGVVITTSGPGFTNALTGLANAYFDSIPLLLVSGQVNTKDKRRNYKFRQYGFQEIQAKDIATNIVKKSYEIDDNSDFATILNEAYRIAMFGRKGPVHIDLPINISRENIIIEDSIEPINIDYSKKMDVSCYMDAILESNRPIIIAGAGINQCNFRKEFRELVELLKIPVVTTMASSDLVPTNSPYYVGYMGGTARREAGIVLKNTDFVISIGTRMCNKSIGYNHKDFIPNAKRLIRIDIDETEFERQLVPNEEDVNVDLRTFIKNSIEYIKEQNLTFNYDKWINEIKEVKNILKDVDLTFGNKLICKLTGMLHSKVSLVFDVGNNLIYGEQSSIVNDETRIFASNGLGSMGYAIPASIGISIGTGDNTYVVTGDGGAQMTIQELNTISKNHLPVKIIIFNNHSLGHIILFQDHYLDCRRIATVEDNGDYNSCNFEAVGTAYGIKSKKITSIEEIDKCKDDLLDNNPYLLEVEFEDCSMLPNIHGGLDPLTNGPKLQDEIITKIRKAIYDIK